MKVKIIDNIFNFLPKELREDLGDDAQIKSWVLQALKDISHQDRFIRDISFHEIDNHNVTLPEDLHSIWKVSYATRQPTELETSRLCECEAQTADSIFTLDPECVTIYHELFLRSEYYNTAFRPLKYKGKKLTSNYVCNVNWSGCHGFYSLNSTASILTTSFQTGFLAIEYNTELKDTTGNYLIPDLYQLWEGLANHVLSKYWLSKSIRSPQLRTLADEYAAKSRTFLTEARGIFKLHNINTTVHRQMIHGKNRLLRAHLLLKTED